MGNLMRKPALVLLSLFLIAAAPIKGQFVELENFFNARSDLRLRKTEKGNIKFVLSPKTLLKIEDVRPAGRHGYGLEVTVQSGPRKGKRVFVYYNARQPQMRLFASAPDSKPSSPSSQADVGAAVPKPAPPETATHALTEVPTPSLSLRAPSEENPALKEAVSRIVSPEAARQKSGDQDSAGKNENCADCSTEPLSQLPALNRMANGAVQAQLVRKLGLSDSEIENLIRGAKELNVATAEYQALVAGKKNHVMKMWLDGLLRHLVFDPTGKLLALAKDSRTTLQQFNSEEESAAPAAAPLQTRSGFTVRANSGGSIAITSPSGRTVTVDTGARFAQKPLELSDGAFAIASEADPRTGQAELFIIENAEGGGKIRARYPFHRDGYGRSSVHPVEISPGTIALNEETDAYGKLHILDLNGSLKFKHELKRNNGAMLKLTNGNYALKGNQAIQFLSPEGRIVGSYSDGDPHYNPFEINQTADGTLVTTTSSGLSFLKLSI
ncbi:MAG: hypothetical protein NDJ89_08415 [Oligoflexia bacterium]|nr:hypothetical protein [Oligoflexia bacterium]